MGCGVCGGTLGPLPGHSEAEPDTRAAGENTAGLSARG